ncbi:MAG TPA: pyrroline-5-carboxylate reductase [Dehalococcoidia bacterium]|nr:pyrroline-5-carboxylate reductase [Dehalococcoidia bacterium]
MKIGFIGGGNMGEAMLAAVLDKGLAIPQDIRVSDISETRRRYLEEKYGVAAVSDNLLAAGNVEVVTLAVKPQNLAQVMADMRGQLKDSQLVLSIIAGAGISTLQPGLGHRSIVRVMPNTPARIGEGISVWTATPEVTGAQKKQAGAILGAMGKEIYVDDEGYLDMATAVSGSGPAYIFLVIEALVEAAVGVGLPRDMAIELVVETMLGSVHFMQESGKTAAELRRMVTSPGGTTAEALLKLEEGGFSSLLIQAVSAAYDRARELGG